MPTKQTIREQVEKEIENAVSPLYDLSKTHVDVRIAQEQVSKAIDSIVSRFKKYIEEEVIGQDEGYKSTIPSTDDFGIDDRNALRADQRAKLSELN